MLDPAELKRTADGIYGEIANTFLPRVSPGLLGLFLAALLAGVMSSCDSFMISSAALFTENIFKPLRPALSDRTYIWVGRIASCFVVMGGVCFAFWVPSVVKALEIWFMIAPIMGIVFWIALLWRKMTVAGAWATTLTGFLAWWMTTQTWFVTWLGSLPAADSLRFLWTEGDNTSVYHPWQILSYLTSATCVGVLVSLVTPAVRKEKLDRFYQLSRTPVGADKEIATPCTLPDGIPASQRPMLATWGGLEVPMPSRESLIGFVVVWLLAGAIIGSFVWLVG